MASNSYTHGDGFTTISVEVVFYDDSGLPRENSHIGWVKDTLMITDNLEGVQRLNIM